MSVVRGPPVFSTDRAIPKFENADGDTIADTQIVVTGDGDIYPNTTSQTIGSAAQPTTSIVLSAYPGPFYETGTFTPGLTAAVPAGLAVIFSSQVGVFYRFGKLVFLHLRVAITAIALNGASGDAIIMGLPFDTAETTLTPITLQEVNTPTLNVMNLTAQLVGGTSTLTIRQTVDGGLASLNLAIGDIDPNTLVGVNGCYPIA